MQGALHLNTVTIQVPCTLHPSAKVPRCQRIRHQASKYRGIQVPRHPDL